MKHTILIILSISIISSCTWMNEHQYEGNYEDETSAEPNGAMPSETGKCYAKCRIPNVYTEEKIDVLEYTGNNPEKIKGVEYQQIIMHPALEEWKKIPKVGCLQINENDCYEWQLIITPEKVLDLYVVTDKSMVSEYKPLTLNTQILSREGGFTEWKEVVCQADVTPELYRNIQTKLKEQGFNTPLDGKVRKETKEALVMFQKVNGLPVGALDKETIKKLGL